MGVKGERIKVIINYMYFPGLETEPRTSHMLSMSYNAQPDAQLLDKVNFCLRRGWLL